MFGIFAKLQSILRYIGNLLMLAYETTDYGRDAGKKGKIPVLNINLGDDEKIQMVLQIEF